MQSGTQTPHRRRRRDDGPLDQHINKPLRRHLWTSGDRLWTRQQLDNERADFFDTRVTGRPEIWQTIRAALDVMQDSGSQGSSEGESEGLATAQTILSAAEISLPTGNLANGVYDSLGNYYQLPEWIVSDPANMVEHSAGNAKGDVSAAEMDETVEELQTDEDESGDEDANRRKQEKGKDIVDIRDQFALRARLSETGRDVDIMVLKSDTVRIVIRKLASESSVSSKWAPLSGATAGLISDFTNCRFLQLPEDKKIRVAYMGKILKESQSLGSQGWQDGHIVNALVFNR